MHHVVCTTNFFPSCKLDSDTILPEKIWTVILWFLIFLKDRKPHELIVKSISTLYYCPTVRRLLLGCNLIWKHLLKQLLTRIYSEYPSPVKFLHSGSLMQPTANLNSVVQDTNLSAPRSLQIVNCFTTVDPTDFPHSKNPSIVVRLSGLLKPILSKPVETEKIHPDTGNGACVKTAVGHKPDRKPLPDSVWSHLNFFSGSSTKHFFNNNG